MSERHPFPEQVASLVEEFCRIFEECVFMTDQGQFDLFSDVIAKLRFEPLSREQQHAQLMRVYELGRESALSEKRAQAKAAAAGALEKRWAGLDAHKAEALRMADEMPFRSRAAAALFISSQIAKDGPGSTYTPPTIEKWLKAAGWKPHASPDAHG